MEKRNLEKYIVNNAKTERYRKSAIPSMQRLRHFTNITFNGSRNEFLGITFLG